MRKGGRQDFAKCFPASMRAQTFDHGLLPAAQIPSDWEWGGETHWKKLLKDGWPRISLLGEKCGYRGVTGGEALTLPWGSHEKLLQKAGGREKGPI
jgi:hypothetical protein